MVAAINPGFTRIVPVTSYLKDRGRESASPSPRISGFVTSHDKRSLRVWLKVQIFRWEMPLGYLAAI